MAKRDRPDGVNVAELGRARVAAELQRAGLVVTRVDGRSAPYHLLAEATLESHPPKLIRRPIRVQAATQTSFRVLKFWGDSHDVILAYTWYVAAPAESVTYALTYDEAVRIVERMEWHHSPSWRVRGGYGTTNAEPNRRLYDLLAPYRMSPSAWWEKVTRTRRS